MAAPKTRDTARFYDALARGDVRRGLWGMEGRFDTRKIITSPSVDRHFRAVVREHVKTEDRLLDLGCGPGGFTAVLAELAGQVVGVDVAPGWVDAATRLFEDLGLGNATARVASGTLLPFPDASFDVVSLVDVIHHLDDPDRVLGEVARVLVPGGRLLVFEPNKLNPLLTLLCVLDRNEWGFLRRRMGTLPSYARLLESRFRVERSLYSGLLIGPDGPRARRLVDALTEGVLAPYLAWLAPKLFVFATKR